MLADVLHFVLIWKRGESVVVVFDATLDFLFVFEDFVLAILLVGKHLVKSIRVDFVGHQILQLLVSPERSPSGADCVSVISAHVEARVTPTRVGVGLQVGDDVLRSCERGVHVLNHRLTEVKRSVLDFLVRGFGLGLCSLPLLLGGLDDFV
jgi:hypothetical protein